MQGLILAAGRGSRMGAQTDSKPKCFNQVAGKRLLDYQRDALSGAYIAPIAAATGYQAEHIAAEIDLCFHNENWSGSNMVRSLLCADTYLARQTSIISYSDIIYTSAGIAPLLQSAGDIVIAYDVNWLQQWSLRFANPLEDAESFTMNAGRQLTDIGQRVEDLAEIQGQYMGLLKMTPAGWQQVRDFLMTLSDTEINKLDMTSLLRRLIHSGVSINCAAYDDFWFEVDNSEDLALCEAQMQTA